MSAVDLGIVRVKPEADPRAVNRNSRHASRVRDIGVYLKQEFIDNEIRFWDRSTPIGYIFLVGTIMGFIVGVIICLSDHLFGHRRSHGRVCHAQGDGLRERLLHRPGASDGVLSFDHRLYSRPLDQPGDVQRLAYDTGLLLEMKLSHAALVLALTLGMCVASGCLAMRKVLAADPAELFT